MPWRLEDVEITELEPELEEEFKDVEHIVRLRLPWPTTKQLQEHVNRRELYRISLSVGEQVILNVENQELPVKLLNLSAGGLGIMCRQEMTLGQQLVLAIGIPEADSEIETEVVWVRKEGDRYRLGLRFLNNNESFRQQMIQQMYRLELLESKGDRTPLKTLTGNTDEDSEDPT
jgi:c-di-GMP-binding flagellar brake protein YcgR